MPCRDGSACFDNPTRFVDPDGTTPIEGPKFPGAIPGTPFHSADAAAIAWGERYGATSLKNHMEFSSVIYKAGDYYYFTGAAWFNNPKDNMVSSPTIAKIIQLYGSYFIPVGATIVGGIHSHDWTGDLHRANYTLSNNNVVGAQKIGEDDEQIMSDAPQYTYYLYNAIGQIRARRPGTKNGSKESGTRPTDTDDEFIADGLPWDPEAEDPASPADNPTPIGPYPVPGHPEVGSDFQGNGFGTNPANPADDKKKKRAASNQRANDAVQQQRAERDSILQ